MFLENPTELEDLVTSHIRFLRYKRQMKYLHPFALMPCLGLDFFVFFARQVALDIASAARYIALAAFEHPALLDLFAICTLHTHLILA